jgi:hypothetical protein
VKKMKKLTEHSIICLAFIVLSACDIQSVSVGEWDISVNTSAGQQQSVWTVSEQGTITMVSQGETVVTDVEMAGSRLSWAGEFSGESGQTLSANFSGTVDGSQLEGTIFTREGNMTVTGSRM